MDHAVRRKPRDALRLSAAQGKHTHPGDRQSTDGCISLCRRPVHPVVDVAADPLLARVLPPVRPRRCRGGRTVRDRKSTRLNSSHANISYAVFCLKKKKKKNTILQINK